MKNFPSNWREQLQISTKWLIFRQIDVNIAIANGTFPYLCDFWKKIPRLLKKIQQWSMSCGTNQWYGLDLPFLRRELAVGKCSQRMKKFSMMNPWLKVKRMANGKIFLDIFTWKGHIIFIWPLFKIQNTLLNSRGPLKSREPGWILGLNGVHQK